MIPLCILGIAPLQGDSWPYQVIKRFKDLVLDKTLTVLFVSPSKDRHSQLSLTLLLESSSSQIHQILIAEKLAMSTLGQKTLATPEAPQFVSKPLVPTSAPFQSKSSTTFQPQSSTTLQPQSATTFQPQSAATFQPRLSAPHQPSSSVPYQAQPTYGHSSLNQVPSYTGQPIYVPFTGFPQQTAVPLYSYTNVASYGPPARPTLGDPRFRMAQQAPNFYSSQSTSYMEHQQYQYKK